MVSFNLCHKYLLFYHFMAYFKLTNISASGGPIRFSNKYKLYHFYFHIINSVIFVPILFFGTQ